MATTSKSKFKQMLVANKTGIVYSSIILFNHFVYGITCNINGAALVDLRFIYHVSIDTISYVTVATGVGYLIGALVGWLYKWLNRQLVLIFLVVFLAVTLALVPYYPNFWVALIVLTASGVASGAWDASSGFWIIEMFPESNSAVLQLQQVYGGGAVLAPMLVSPYVRGEKMVENGHNVTTADRVHSLSLPYAVNGLLHLIAPLLWTILFFTFRYRHVPPSKQVENATDSTKDMTVEPNKIPNRKLKLAICGVALAIYGSAELGWFQFSTTMFQYIDIHLDAATATQTQSILSATYTAGRLASAFITLKVIPEYVIAYHYLIMAGGLSTIYLGRDSKTAIYAGSAILGYGFSAMWPAIFGASNRLLHMTDRAYSIFSFLTGIVSLVIPMVLGQSFHAYPMMLFLLESIFIALSFILLVTAWIWTVIDKRK